MNLSSIRQIKRFFFSSWVMVALVGLGVVPLLGGLGVLGWQVVHWLDVGQWISISVLDFLIWFDYKRGWAENPDTWFGLWKALNWLPLSGTAVVYGAFMSLIFGANGPEIVDNFCASSED